MCLCVLDFLLGVYKNLKIYTVSNMLPMIRKAYRKEGQFHLWLVHSEHGLLLCDPR